MAKTIPFSIGIWYPIVTAAVVALLCSAGSNLLCSIYPDLPIAGFTGLRVSGLETTESPCFDKKMLYFAAFILLWALIRVVRVPIYGRGLGIIIITLILPVKGLWRYTRLLVHLVASWTFQPIMTKADPAYRPQDCTVVLATVDGKNKIFGRCVDSILANRPCKLVVVVPIQHAMRLIVRFHGFPNVLILGSPIANKRLQQVCGLRVVNTAVTVLCDDDVIWPITFLHNALAVFEDASVGAGGTCQRLLREHSPNIWEFLGAVYLERRNFEFSATTHIDGGISALSGRTQLVRTCILKDQEFIRRYLSEKWLSWLPMQGADDDNFITRWMVNNGWKIRIQYCPEAELRTVLEDNFNFIGQCVRWFRTTWRSNATSMLVDRVIWSTQPWCSYALHLSTLNPPAAVMDSTLAWLLLHVAKIYLPDHVTLCMAAFSIWLIFTKIIKLVPHFWRYPTDLKFLPCHILFGYLHGLIKFYALLTVGSTKWLGRAAHTQDDNIIPENAFGVDGPSLVKMGLQNVGRQLEVDELDLPEIVKRDVCMARSIFEPDI